MTRANFDDLVHRVEARYQGRPEALERTTSAWIRLGQGVAVAWVALLLGLGGAAIAGGIVLSPEYGVLLIGLGVAVTVYAISQAALLGIAAPDDGNGRALRPGEAPALVTLLDDLRRELACRPFGEVRLSMDFNAGVRESPRRGIRGGSGSVLDLGLPLMAALTPEEFRAVLAHEFAHLSAHHGIGSHRIGRLCRTWDALIRKLEGRPSGRSDRAVRWAVSRFVDWYWPRFRARAVVLSRFQEYQADRVAAELAGAETLASALWRMECVGPWLLERFWVDLQNQAAQLPEPPDNVLAHLCTALEVLPPADQAARWTERGRSRSTGVDDTHPAYADRARALGVVPEAVHPAGFRTMTSPTAAEALLGTDLDHVASELSRTWSRSQSAQWRERHRRLAAESRRRESKSTVVVDGPAATVDVSALWESARELMDLQGLDAALPALRAVLDHDPLHAGAAVFMGHYLVNHDDGEGERLLWGVIERGEQHWIHRACESLQEHYRITGQADRLRDVRSRLDRFDVEIEQAGRERTTISASDILLNHGLTDEQLAPLRSLLITQRECATAWLARKKLLHFPQRPLFLLCVRTAPTRWGFSDPEGDRELVRRLLLRVELPGQVLVVTRHGTFRSLADKLRAQRGSQIYIRESPKMTAR